MTVVFGRKIVAPRRPEVLTTKNRRSSSSPSATVLEESKTIAGLISRLFLEGVIIERRKNCFALHVQRTVAIAILELKNERSPPARMCAIVYASRQTVHLPPLSKLNDAIHTCVPLSRLDLRPGGAVGDRARRSENRPL